MLCERFFFALRPPAREANRIAAFARDMAGDPASLLAHRLHLTLAISGNFDDFPAAYVDTMLRVGDRVVVPPFWLCLDRLSFGAQSAALRPGKVSPGLMALRRALVSGMAEARAPLRRGAGFSPHVTLFYDALPPGNRATQAFAWKVETFVLIHSRVGRTEHRILRTWPLHMVPTAQYALF